MNENLYLLSDAAKALKRRPYQIVYAITSGLVPEPTLRIGNKRIFQIQDLERLKSHFSNRPASAHDRRKEAHNGNQ
jgi:hypothetical protein